MELFVMVSCSSWKLELRKDKDAVITLPVKGAETRSDLMFVKEQQTV